MSEEMQREISKISREIRENVKEIEETTEYQIIFQRYLLITGSAVILYKLKAGKISEEEFYHMFNKLKNRYECRIKECSNLYGEEVEKEVLNRKESILKKSTLDFKH
ncbi:MAG: hypothetical protein QW412_02750 [Candidatus Aenigmatarchaeota archaeon]